MPGNRGQDRPTEGSRKREHLKKPGRNPLPAAGANRRDKKGCRREKGLFPRVSTAVSCA